MDNVAGEKKFDEATKGFHTGEKAPVKPPLLPTAGIQGGYPADFPVKIVSREDFG
jgi:hypothetical protein